MANQIKTTPFQGGVNTILEKSLIPSGKFSVMKNLRQRHPGMEQRKGQIRTHATADATLETMTLYSSAKGEVTERRFFRQLSDGSVQEASTLPPGISLGTFGSDVLSAVSGALPASWAVLNDMVLFSDNVRQHQLLLGNTARIKAFIVHKSTVAIPRIPINGERYTDEVTDNFTTTFGKVGGLSTANNAIFIMSDVPVSQFNFTMETPNTAITVANIYYWNGTAYVAVAGLTDTTDLAGAMLGKSGTMSWTMPTDELPNYQFGQSGFWYKIVTVTLALDATVNISKVTCGASFQDIRNVWNGVLTNAIEAQVYSSILQTYLIYGSTGIDVSKLKSGDHVYFATIDPIFGVNVNTGATPNKVNATITGSDMSFNDGGTSDDYIKRAAADVLSAGFEAGQSVTISGSASNNITATIIAVNSNSIFFPTGTLVAEVAGAAVTITFGPNTTALNTFEVWTGSGWTAVGTRDDTILGLTKSGFITWDRNSVIPERTQFNESTFYAYWYRMTFDKALSAKVNIGITVLPYYSMSSFGKGLVVEAWKNRAVYVFDQFPQYINISATDAPMVLNGSDFGILEMGDGRINPVRAIRKFYNEMLVWQEERGEAGGCTTLVEGFNPTNYGKLVISTKIGILNSKAVVVIEGVITSTRTEEKVKTLAFWLSRFGVMMTDGRTITAVSDDIRNYFDPARDESLRKGYENKMWLNHDSSENVLRLGLVSGQTATEPNIFPVFDLVDRTWSFDTLGQSLECMVEAEADTGKVSTIQMAGGADGYVYQLNQTNDDVNVPIDSDLTVELSGEGNRLRLREVVLQVAARSNGNIDFEITRNGNPDFPVTSLLSMMGLQTNDTYRRHRFNQVVDGDHLSIRWRNNNSGESMYLLSTGLSIGALDTNV